MVSSSEQPRQRPKAESNGRFQRPPPLDLAKRVTVPSLDRPIKQGQNHPFCLDPLEWPPFGGSLDGSTGQIILPMTPTEIARELELLRPFLKEIMIRDYRYDRVRLGPAFKEPAPPDVTIDSVISSV